MTRSNGINPHSAAEIAFGASASANAPTRSSMSGLLRLAVLPALALALLPSQLRAQQTFRFATIDDPAALHGTVAKGINDRGQIVGFYTTVTQHGFVLSKGVFTTIDFPGAANGTQANGINNRGQVVGLYADEVGRSHGFVLSRGAYTTIDDPKGQRRERFFFVKIGEIQCLQCRNLDTP